MYYLYDKIASGRGNPFSPAQNETAAIGLWRMAKKTPGELERKEIVYPIA
jgi:hypothetical protein